MYIPKDFKEHAYDTHVSLIIRYNVSPSQIQKWKREVGMLKARGRPPLKLDVNKIIEFKRKGWSNYRIAKHFRCSERVIRTRLRQGEKHGKNINKNPNSYRNM